MYFKIGVDGVTANSKTMALEIYNNYHGANETKIEEITAIAKMTFVDDSLPHIDSIRYDETKNTNISEVFWYYKNIPLIEGMFK